MVVRREGAVEVLVSVARASILNHHNADDLQREAGEVAEVSQLASVPTPNIIGFHLLFLPFDLMRAMPQYALKDIVANTSLQVDLATEEVEVAAAEAEEHHVEAEERLVEAEEGEEEVLPADRRS